MSNRATLRQREARKNVPLLQSLVNKAPLARAAEIHGISFQTIYDKLDFFHRQVLQFTAKQETKLRELVKGTKRYISVDRQDYAVNWTHRKDKRNIVLRAIGSADLESGFVFGMHLNFDGSLDADLARIFHRSRATNEDGIALVCPKIQVSNLDQRAGNAEAKLYRRN